MSHFRLPKFFKCDFLKMAKMEMRLCCTQPSIYCACNPPYGIDFHKLSDYVTVVTLLKLYWSESWLCSLGVGQNLRPLESNLTWGSPSAVSDRLITVCVGGVRGIVTRGFSGDLMETSVEVFLMSIDINRVNSYWTNVFEVYNAGYL